MNISSTGHADPPKAEKYPHNFAVNSHNTTSPLSAPKHFAPNDVPIPGRIGFDFIDCTMDTIRRYSMAEGNQGLLLLFAKIE